MRKAQTKRVWTPEQKSDIVQNHRLPPGEGLHLYNGKPNLGKSGIKIHENNQKIEKCVDTTGMLFPYFIPSPKEPPKGSRDQGFHAGNSMTGNQVQNAGPDGCSTKTKERNTQKFFISQSFHKCAPARSLKNLHFSLSIAYIK